MAKPMGSGGWWWRGLSPARAQVSGEALFSREIGGKGKCYGPNRVSERVCGRKIFASPNVRLDRKIGKRNLAGYCVHVGKASDLGANTPGLIRRGGNAGWRRVRSSWRLELSKARKI